MKRAALVLTLPFVLSGCAFVNGEHHVVLKSQSVLVEHDTKKVTQEDAYQRAVEQCSWKFGKKPVLQSSTPPGNPATMQGDFYRCT